MRAPRLKIAPLHGSFMLTSIIGFFISTFIIFNTYPDWGFAFALICVIMFIASLIAMVNGPEEVLQIDEKRKYKF